MDVDEYLRQDYLKIFALILCAYMSICVYVHHVSAVLVLARRGIIFLELES